jgi:hypothetical protein
MIDRLLVVHHDLMHDGEEEAHGYQPYTEKKKMPMSIMRMWLCMDHLQEEDEGEAC